MKVLLATSYQAESTSRGIKAHYTLKFISLLTLINEQGQYQFQILLIIFMILCSLEL